MSGAFMRARALGYRLVIALLRIFVRPPHHVCYRLTILKLDRLGDAVLSLGAVRKLVSVFPEKETLLIVSTIAAPLYRREFPAATLLVMPPFCERFWPDFLPGVMRHAAALRAIVTEHLVCLRHQHSDYLHAIAMMINARRCHASRWEGNGEHTGLSFPRCQFSPYPDKSPAACLELEAHRRVVESVLGSPVGVDEMMPALRNITVTDGGSLLVCPVAGSPLRQYPAERLAEAIWLFLQQWPDTPVNFCLPPEADRKHWEDAFAARHSASVQWSVPNDLESLVDLIARARIVLAPDSAPAHIATALDKPGVFLLGGGHFGMFGPWRKSERQIWLHHAMDCYQCRWRCTQPEPYCITHIDPGDIARSLAALCASTTDSHEVTSAAEVCAAP